MRNLKRALSLTLASVMLLGMMVLGTSAASYPDVTDEHNVEAIEVLQTIGVMSGSNSGNFNPDSKVSRIEMAIVMANLLDLDVNYFQGQNQFSDVPEWASGYVNACAASGIVTGVGGGRFGTGNVTATQAALMMLKALGYFQYASDFNGDWARATALQASKISLFKGLDVRDNTQLTRNHVAQLALNALQATMVDAEDNTLHITTGEDAGNINISGGSVKYIVRTSDDNKIGTAIRTGNAGSGTSGSQLYGQTLELGEHLYQGDLVKRDTNAIADEFARPATEWRLKGEKIGVYNDEPDATYTKSVKIGQIYKDLGLNRTIPASRVSVYVDGIVDPRTDSKAQTAKAIKSGDDTNKYGDNGILTQVFYDQDTDSVVITEINTYTGEIARSVAASGTKEAYVVISTEGNAGERPAGVSGNLNYETDASFDNDVRVLYTYSQATDEVMSVKVAESVEGTVTRAENSNTNDNDRKAVTIADQRYTASANSAGEKTSDVTVKNDYVVYLDAYGYIIYIEESEVAINNYALLINTASSSTFIGNRARLLFTDGTIKNVETEKNYNSGSDKIARYTIVTTRVDADGVYTLKAVDANKSYRNAIAAGANPETGNANGELLTTDYANVANGFAMKSDKAGITVNSGAKKYALDGSKNPITAGSTVFNANSATAFVVADAGKDGADSDFTAYTGIKNAPTVTATASANQGVAAYWFCKNGNMITAMFVFPGSAIEIEDSNNKLVFISKESVSNLIHDNDGDYYEYDTVIGTEAQENTKVADDVKVNGTNLDDSDSSNGPVSADTKRLLGGLYKSYTIDKHNIITGVKTYDVYGSNAPTNAPGDKEEVLVGVGIDKTSKEYTVILNNHYDAAISNYGSAATITVDDAAKIWYVDVDGNISESSYRGISVDDDDIVYAVVKDFLVKTLVIQQVDTSSSANAVPVSITADKNNVIVNDTVTLTAEATLGRYDTVNGYKWYKSATSYSTVTDVEAHATALNTGKTCQPDTSATGTTYYYCIVETTNDRASDTAESLGKYTVVVRPDPASSKNFYVSYRTDGDDESSQVGYQSVTVDLSEGGKLLDKDNALFTVPKYYKLASAQTNGTFASGAKLFTASDNGPIIIVVEKDPTKAYVKNATEFRTAFNDGAVKEITVKAGTYEFNAEMIMNNNVPGQQNKVITGEGGVTFEATNADEILIVMTNNTLTVKNIKFTSIVTIADKQGAVGIKAVGDGKVVVEGCEFENIMYGIFLSHDAGATKKYGSGTVTDCTFKTNENAINISGLDGTKTIEINDCTFTDSKGSNAIYVDWTGVADNSSVTTDGCTRTDAGGLITTKP